MRTNQSGIDLNTTLWDAEFKDVSPLKTVEQIKHILAEQGIETQEIWNESAIPYCFGITIRGSGTTFSINGKIKELDFDAFVNQLRAII